MSRLQQIAHFLGKIEKQPEVWSGPLLRRLQRSRLSDRPVADLLSLGFELFGVSPGGCKRIVRLDRSFRILPKEFQQMS